MPLKNSLLKDASLDSLPMSKLFTSTLFGRTLREACCEKYGAVYVCVFVLPSRGNGLPLTTVNDGRGGASCIQGGKGEAFQKLEGGSRGGFLPWLRLATS